MFSKKTLDGYFYKTKGFYLFFIPVKVPYQAIYQKAENAGLKKKEQFGPILEKAKLLGFGWIGVEVEAPSSKRDDVVHVAGNFEMYEYKGPYKTLGRAYKKLLKERPKAKDYLNLYLDDPNKVAAEECRTQILFR